MKFESTRSANGSAERDAAVDDLSPAAAGAWLSALVDGDASAVQQACTAWRNDDSARQQWHTYHLIGDVMRSDELAASPSEDLAFLHGLRARLAAEPVVLAPADPVTTLVAMRRRPAWLMPAAAAAGFAVVAGVLVVAGIGLPGGTGDASTLARMQDPSGSGLKIVSDVQRRAAPAVNQDGLIRDARLDDYLRAHQSARGGVAVASPNGALRRVDQTVPVGADR